MRINLEKLYLDTYDKDNIEHQNLVKQFVGDSRSGFISKIDSNLTLKNKQKSFPFDTAFIVSNLEEELLGYVFISSVSSDEVYLESSLLKEQRGKGYGSLILRSVTDYLFTNYNIRDIALDIDVSNEASMRTAINCGYYEDEYANNKIIYRNYNLNYLNKRKKGR